MILKRILVLTALVLLFAFAAFSESEMPYDIDVDLDNQIVTVYRAGERGDDAIVRQMLCSSGKANRTPKGRFYIFTRPEVDRKEWYYIRAYNAYVQYSTRIYNDYLFHSLPCSKADLSTMDETARANMGKPASHGCIRLYPEDAKWIALNCLDNTVCHIYLGGEPKESLRALLYENSFYLDGPWKNYEEFLGYSDTAVCLTSSKEEIQALKTRLRGAGYYTGEIDGVFSNELRACIRNAQSAAGLPESGLGDQELIKALDENRIPAGVQVTLSVGDRGSAVSKLQTALSALGYWTQPVDGVYSEELAETVRMFRLVRNMGESLEADSELQMRAVSDAENFQMPEGAELKIEAAPVDVAVLTESKMFGLRTYSSTGANTICYIKKGEYARVIEKDGGWTYVEFNGEKGYLKNYYLTFETRMEYTETYVYE